MTYNDPLQSAESSNQNLRHTKNHSNIYDTTNNEKLKNKEGTVCFLLKILKSFCIFFYLLCNFT